MKIELDFIAVNDIQEALFKINQCLWLLNYNKEPLTNAEKSDELKNLVKQANFLAKNAKLLKKDFDYQIACYSD